MKQTSMYFMAVSIIPDRSSHILSHPRNCDYRLELDFIILRIIIITVSD